MRISLVALLVLQTLSSTSAINLKVGIYNEIPDLGKDHLASYQKLIQDGFAAYSQGNTVDAVVDKDLYSPYADLAPYLTADNFDLIEIDTATLGGLVRDGLVLELSADLPTNPSTTFTAALDGVRVGNNLYGYPTLLCGNFLIGLTPPGSADTCSLSKIDSYTTFVKKLEDCEKKILKGQCDYKRIFGGKMNDADGWYLPFLYLDGYIDVHGPTSVNVAVTELMNGKVDENVCTRLSWYISRCDNQFTPDAGNKCYDKFPGSYVSKSSNVFNDIKDKKTAFFFGFSEKSTLVPADVAVAYSALSGPLGPNNYLLQFTDALVINKARWNVADNVRKRAVKDFINYFVGLQLRNSIATGQDLTPPRYRYLLQARTDFYTQADMVADLIYSDIFWSLKTAVAAPSLNDTQRETMQGVLSSKCTNRELQEEEAEVNSRVEL
eukprot:TRINITY_DN81_c1_g1_i3.p1 TRINITY_DN81_c1_g1~~TRINITY_DN81_c1_g1_i3.p1  ORF type:complete len:437 (-),score=36.43 TRINITY_DN81_c1_g1_i3:1441-2751(-)